MFESGGNGACLIIESLSMRSNVFKQVIVRTVAFMNGVALGLVPVLSVFILMLNLVSRQETVPYVLVSRVLRYFPVMALAGVYGWLVAIGISVIILVLARRAWHGISNSFQLLVAIVTLTRLLVIPFWIGLTNFEASEDTIARYGANFVLVVVNVGALIIVTLIDHDAS